MGRMGTTLQGEVWLRSLTVQCGRVSCRRPENSYETIGVDIGIARVNDPSQESVTVGCLFEAGMHVPGTNG